jgi:uncharacterized protein
MKTKESKNRLGEESSPYLLQHAHNPVNWLPWNDETLGKARYEDKLILVSIGYSACHWCHVMAHESFENEEVALIMNENFICIKVDREEHPDVDQLYMDAVQILNGNGGWPLNCFALPDGRPFWGGTYFRKEQWINILNQIIELKKRQYGDLVRHADELVKGIREQSLIKTPSLLSHLEASEVDNAVKIMVGRFNHENGGEIGSPKFPMPVNSMFLLNYYYYTGSKEILNHVELTLDKMSAGGIYDQVGGGFSRYSVDEFWHIPHFEKMLYDNAQLVSLYSTAYKITHNEFYRQAVDETLYFIEREMTSPEGGFYSALDADSEGSEGKFYVWTRTEINDALEADSQIACDFFGIDDEAKWEGNKNVLVRATSFDQLAQKYGIEEQEIKTIIQRSKEKLLNRRAERFRPGTDDKILTSWNALMSKAFVDAFSATGNIKYLQKARKNLEFLLRSMRKKDKGLFHSFNKGDPKIAGFLEDYAFMIEALIKMYEVTFEENWLMDAKFLADYSIIHFFDENTGMFSFNSDENKNLFTRKAEVIDKVIPSSNAVLAASLYRLGLLFDNTEYLALSEKMLLLIKDNFVKYPSSFANWGMFGLNLVYRFKSVVFLGPDALRKSYQISKRFLPGVLLAGAESFSEIPLLKDKFNKSKSQIFICTGNECMPPVETVEEALEILNGSQQVTKEN